MSYKVVDKKIISIPYGAIKSLRGALNLTQKKRFQFLMVRLKEYLDLVKIITNIKFQFLMVRLKELQT